MKPSAPRPEPPARPTALRKLAAKALVAFVGALALTQFAGPRTLAALPPTELPGLRYSEPFFPGVTYRAAIPSLDTLLGFPAAERAATGAEIERCLHAWTNAAPDRTRLVEYARSHEGRPLHYLVITSPTNLARLDDLQAGFARLGDPRRTSEAEARELIDRLPPVAWLAYTIHGDETEGSDAALVVIHHLLAADDPAVTRLLDRLVIIVDPLMNPDGRERFVKMIGEHRGTTPSVDEQSLLHSGYWPWGRGNHYLFDLNRDWLFAVHPETRGRLREIARWNPVLFVDAHGMGAQATHLFSPPREPLNPNIPTRKHAWSERFAVDQAAAFDRRGLVYYTGEWAEEWYPGYSDSWTTYRGGVGILYEQARIAADAVRRPEGRLLSYRESVLHHVVGTFANLETTRAHGSELLADLHATRREAIDPVGPYGRRTFAILPTANRSRFQAFTDLLRLQGFELHTATAELPVAVATNQLGETIRDRRLPAGTLLVPNRQPLAHLLAAFLEFDPRLSPKALEEERREILRFRGSLMYDATSWNLTMMYGLESLTLPIDLPADGTRPFTDPDAAPVPAPEAAPGGPAEHPVAFVFDGADDLSLAAAARLTERGVQVRASDKPFVFDGTPFARGSIVVTRLDNRTFTGNLAETIARTARELGLPFRAAASGLGPGDLPDLGGEHFPRLEPPRIATVGRDGVEFTDYGSIWYTLDHRLGIRHSQLNSIRNADLGRYNVLILPENWSTEAGAALPTLKDWVRNGGTLIAIGDATLPFLPEKAEFGHVRNLPDVLGRLPEYELAVLREWQGRHGPVPAESNVWSHLAPARIDYPWQMVDGDFPEEKELKRRDAWQSVFMPQGAFLATRLDTNHWLTAGCPEPLPILAGHGPVLMVAEGAEAPIRFGIFTKAPVPPPTNGTPAEAAPSSEGGPGRRDPAGSAAVRPARAAGRSGESRAGGDEEDHPEAPRIGWSALPPNTALQLRLSGLVWPEATHRLAHSAWVTRESFGRGQIILFASPPTYRAGAVGSTRVFLNAVVLGPGIGASTPLRP